MIQKNIEFRRRIDGTVYRYHPCTPINGQPAWKREDIDLWITQIKDFGWACIDNEGTVYGMPWAVTDKASNLPPVGEWVSKKGDKSYVYDLSIITSQKIVEKHLSKPKNIDSAIIEVGTAEERNLLDDKITAYNAQQIPFTQTETFINLDYVIKNDSNNVIAGITAVLYCWKCLFINVLWVAENYRNQKYGSMLIEKLESSAKKLGCKLVHLDTFDFQAKNFYLKLGYEIFGELNNCPQDHVRYFLKKEL